MIMLSLTKYDNSFLQRKKMFKKLIKKFLYKKKWLHQSDIYKIKTDNILNFFLIFLNLKIK